jgi:hypothetical protein
MVDFVLGLMNSIEDNGIDFCLFCQEEDNDLVMMILSRPEEE